MQSPSSPVAPEPGPAPTSSGRGSRPGVLTLGLVATLATSLALASLVGCGGGDDEPAGGGLRVAVAAYPLRWLVEQVGGDQVEVVDLAGGGSEPHDIELTPRQVASVARADLVVHLRGFQPALDTAVDDVASDHAFDAAEHTGLRPVSGGSADDHDDDHGDGRAAALDPHFWLDPSRLAEVGSALAERLARIDPGHGARYSANAAVVEEELSALDAELASGLARCARQEVVTTHTAFGYLAERYGLEEVGITGVSAEHEPSPADLARLADFVEEHGVTTVYVEARASTDVAAALATEAGVDTAVLDPLEVISDRSAGDDYLEVMRANLRSLREGQGCA